MKTLGIILAELQRQYDESRAHGIGWLDTENPQSAVLDGRVDLVALAAALDKATIAVLRDYADKQGEKGIGNVRMVLLSVVSILARDP